MTLTDTHCHLDVDRFDADRESVIERATQAGVSRMLVPALNAASASQIISLARRHHGVYAAVGVHPTEIGNLTTSGITALEHLASESKVVAIGEIGLDYYWVLGNSGRTKQQAALRLQLELAEACGIPVVLHLREQDNAHEGACANDMLRILEDWTGGLHARGSALASKPGVLHSFAGTLEIATAAIAMGFCIGITGPVTYPSAEGRRQVVQHLPLDHLLIETDSPFLAPQQHRGRRNEPAFVSHIADRIAEVQSRAPGDVAYATSRNAARLFGWGETD